MDFSKNINYFDQLGQQLRFELSNPAKIDEILTKTQVQNPWFIKRFTLYALDYWAHHLNAKNLEHWLANYAPTKTSQNIGLILAGNIPMVGFHDVLCVLLSGHHASIKLSDKDAVLIPYVLDLLCNIEPSFKNKVTYIQRQSSGFDKLIATGSNNSARYFEYYFKDIPHIIRKNRTSIAVLDGHESKEDLKNLTDDLFLYFGLGCRNVSNLWIPKNYNFDALYEAFGNYEFILDHKKYFNNYQYYKTIELLNTQKIFDLGICILKPTDSLFSPISVINLHEYERLPLDFSTHQHDIQCIIGKEYAPFGSSQMPVLHEYADGVDTMSFLGEY